MPPPRFPIHMPPPSWPPSTGREPSRQEGDQQRADGAAAPAEDPSFPWGWMFAGALAAAVLGAAAVLFRRGRVVRVRITSTPDGDAPEAIRRAWVGLELPLAPGERGPRLLDAAGVVWRLPAGVKMGYAVGGRVAVELLEKQSPAAAAWWRQQVPDVLTAGFQFVFPAESCEKVACPTANDRPFVALGEDGKGGIMYR